MAESFRSPAKVLRRLKLLPQIASHVKNWPSFMYHYALGLTPAKPYQFHNGALLNLQHALEHAPLLGIVLRSEYGTPPDGAVVIDIGANIGGFCIWAAKMSRDLRVYAYEPSGEAYRMLETNIRLNALSETIKCFNVAVAGSPEPRQLFVSGTEFYFPTLVAPVNPQPDSAQPAACTTLSEIIEENSLEQVDFLKIDVEGGEYDILYRTPHNYFARIREIRMEYHNLDQQEQNVSGLRTFLTAQGYSITHDEELSPKHGLLWARLESGDRN